MTVEDAVKLTGALNVAEVEDRKLAAEISEITAKGWADFAIALLANHTEQIVRVTAAAGGLKLRG